MCLGSGVAHCYTVLAGTVSDQKVHNVQKYLFFTCGVVAFLLVSQYIITETLKKM
jgi:bacteriorhodopsin